MNKDLKEYLCVLANNMYSINYAIKDDDIKNKNGVMSYTGDSCQEIFERNDIPDSSQRIYISINILKNVFCKDEFGNEYLTNVPIKIFKNRYNDYSTQGEMFGKYPGFRFINARECDEKEIIHFMSNLKQDGLFDKYLKCLGEIFQLNIKTREDEIGMQKQK